MKKMLRVRNVVLRVNEEYIRSAGIGDDDEITAASRNAGSFGLFIRSLVGLDREAAKAAFVGFLDEDRYSKNQIAFVNLIINYPIFTEHILVVRSKCY